MPNKSHIKVVLVIFPTLWRAAYGIPILLTLLK